MSGLYLQKKDDVPEPLLPTPAKGRTEQHPLRGAAQVLLLYFKNLAIQSGGIWKEVDLDAHASF